MTYLFYVLHIVSNKKYILNSKAEEAIGADLFIHNWVLMV